MTRLPKLIAPLLCFVLTVIYAAVSNWSAGDMVWGLWISSLVLGSSFLLVSIFVMALHGPADGSGGIATLVNNPAKMAQAAFGVLFFVAFFSFHFIFFHFVHSAFLGEFFPLDGRSSRFRMGPTPASFPGLVATVFARYWPFVLLSAAGVWDEYARAIHRGGANAGGVLFRPYINVVRMHLTIFAVAFLNGVGLKALALYPVLFLYFLPYGEIREAMRAKSDEAANTGRPR